MIIQFPQRRTRALQVFFCPPALKILSAQKNTRQRGLYIYSIQISSLLSVIIRGRNLERNDFAQGCILRNPYNAFSSWWMQKSHWACILIKTVDVNRPWQKANHPNCARELCVILCSRPSGGRVVFRLKKKYIMYLFWWTCAFDMHKLLDICKNSKSATASLSRIHHGIISKLSLSTWNSPQSSAAAAAAAGSRGRLLRVSPEFFAPLAF